MVDRLNASGRTVVLITHENEVARHAKRVLHLVDGQIVADVRQGPVAGPPPALRDPDAFAAEAPPGVREPAGAAGVPSGGTPR